jgi:undecaprenyl-diphosphatase
MAPLAAFICLTWPTSWRRPVLLLASPCVLLVGVSRIALDKHYPTDVLAGWATALVWVAGAWAAVRPALGSDFRRAERNHNFAGH